MTRDEAIESLQGIAIAIKLWSGDTYKVLSDEILSAVDVLKHTQPDTEIKEDPYLQIYVDKYLSAGYFGIHFCPMCGRGLT